MQTVSAQLTAMLTTAFRAPSVYVWAQIPVITNAATSAFDAQKLGSQIILDKILSFNRVSILDTGADSMDFSLDNTLGQYSPLNKNSALGRYMQPGAVDIKYQAWMGNKQNGAETVLPKGVFVSETVSQQLTPNGLSLTINTLDQFSLFRGDAYTSMPPRLYGQQQGSYFNPNFALKNPSGDNKTFVSDTLNWMTSSSQVPMWAADYIDVTVYKSDVGSGMTAVPNSGATAYTIDYINGKVTFTTAQSAGITVSVDAKPLAMKPEVALQHLFIDFGAWDPNFLKFDQSGTVMPVVDLARDRPVIDIAKDIIYMIAPHGIRWRLWIDEAGYIRLTEGAVDGPPVKTLVDTRDILEMSPEYSVSTLLNVIRADAISVNNQPLESIAYSVNSINIFTQKPTYDVPQQFTNICRGMDSGTAMSYLNSLTSSLLFEYCMPQLRMDIKIVPDISLQIGDGIWITEAKTGLDNPFIIKQIQESVTKGLIDQTLSVDRLIQSQDYMMGIQANIGAPVATDTNLVQVQSGLITRVGFSDSSHALINVVSGGEPVTDGSFLPIVYNWDGTPLNIQIDVTPPSGANLYIWRWLYIAEDVYNSTGVVTGNGSAAGLTSAPASPGSNWALDLTGAMGTVLDSQPNASHTYPYDWRTNTDTPISRKFWWPLLLCSDWVTNDGITAYSTSQAFSSTWSGGPGVSGSFKTYGNLRIGQNNYFSNTTSGFKGVQIYGPGTPAATTLGASSNISYGVDYGINYSGTVWSGIKRKQTPCFLGILIATTNGGMQLKRIPLMLRV